MVINSHIANNQDLTQYLSRLENRMVTEEFFAKLKNDESLDPANFQVRETWLRDGSWYGEYMVVFGRHFFIRACQRIGAICEVIDAVMKQLSNNNILQAVTNHPIYWDNGEITFDNEAGIRAVAVLEEDVPFVCIYECGQSYIYPRTVLKKSPRMFFYSDTLVVVSNKDGSVTIK